MSAEQCVGFPQPEDQKLSKPADILPLLSIDSEYDACNEVQTLIVGSHEGLRRIPVYSIRNSKSHPDISRAIASGKPIAFEVGVIGILIAVSASADEGNDNGSKFWTIKKGRSPNDRVPMMLRPKDHPKVVDYNKLHPDFRYLADDKEARERFYGNLPLHTILPVRTDTETINRQVFVTTPTDLQGKPTDQYVPCPTVCLYFQDDEDWMNIAEQAHQLNPNVMFGITSFNDHGQPSPFNFNELLEYVQRRGKVDFEAVVRDPIVEKADIRSSHTQIRLPLEGEAPEILIVRKGPVSADAIRETTGHPVRVLESAKLAGRGHPDDVDLYSRVVSYLEAAKVNISIRKK